MWTFPQDRMLGGYACTSKRLIFRVQVSPCQLRLGYSTSDRSSQVICHGQKKISIAIHLHWKRLVPRVVYLNHVAYTSRPCHFFINLAISGGQCRSWYATVQTPRLGNTSSHLGPCFEEILSALKDFHQKFIILVLVVYLILSLYPGLLSSSGGCVLYMVLFNTPTSSLLPLVIFQKQDLSTEDK